MKHIKNIGKLFRLDWQRIGKNPIATVLIIALMIIPSLYAWFNIEALWDPYANTSELPIAVYSDDQTANFKGKDINIGDEVLEKLHKNKQLGWRFVASKKELDEGVKSGNYYAAIYLPKDFSKNLLSFTTGEIHKPKIVYSMNEKINAIAPKIASKGASSLQEQISEEFTKTASGTLLTTLNEVGYNLDANLLSITKAKNMILSVDENSGTFEKYAQEIVRLNGKLPDLKDKLNKANEFVDYLPEVDALGNRIIELNEMLPTIKEQGKIILTLQQKIPEIQEAGQQIAMIDEDFVSVEKTVTEGINEAKQGLYIIQGVQQALPDIQNLGNQADSLSIATMQGAQKIQDALPGITSSVKITLETIKSININIVAIAGKIQQMLVDGELTVEEREELKQTFQQLSENLGKQQFAAQQLTEMLSQIQQQAGNQSLQSAIDNLTQISHLLGNLKQKVETIDVENITTKELQAVLNDLQIVANDMNNGASSIEPDSIAATVNELLTKLLTTIGTAQGLLAEAKKIDINTLLNSTEKTVTNAISILEKYQTQLPAMKQEIHEANKMFNSQMSTIVNGINKGADLYNNELPTIESKLGLAATFIQKDYPQVKKDITNTVTTVNEKIPDLEITLNKASEWVENDWPNIEVGIHKAANTIRKGEKEVDLNQVIKLLKLDAEKESEFFSKPVEISEKQIYPIKNNGSASTPFYTALCLWVGAVLFSSVVTTDYYLEEKEKGLYSKREQFVARMLTFLIVGLAQGLIVSLGNYYLLGVDVKKPVLSVLFTLLIALAFMIMVYVLVGLFGNIGKGLAIIILVLSISGGGGNYPIQVSGKFFQRINPFLPFTHAVNLLRESAGGIYWPNAWLAIVIMVGLILAFSIVGTLVYPYITEKTKKLAEISHESHLFH